MASTGKQLICPQCEKVMASASWRFFTGLRITALDGSRLTPVSNDLLLRSNRDAPGRGVGRGSAGGQAPAGLRP